MAETMKHVVIVGGGFGGLYLARALKNAPVRVTLVDRRNFHLFQPLLYQVATGGLSPANIAAPLRSLLRKQRNAQVLLAEITDVDPAARRVFADGRELSYDLLVLATGSTFNYFGHDDWQRLAPGLKTIEDATEIRSRIFTAFETAEQLRDPSEISAWLRFVIVGGGPTGVEMAGALAEVAYYTLRNDFRSIRPDQAEILLIEAQDRLLTAFPEQLSKKAQESLARLRVTVLTQTLVTAVEPGRVLTRRENNPSMIEAHTVIWTAGVKASSLATAVAERCAIELDRAGRIVVDPDLRIPGQSEIFVIGDLALAKDENGDPLPGVAPVAMQQGRYVANLIRRGLLDEPHEPFRYHNRGNLATIGRSMAVADFGWMRFSGLLAWILWLLVHLMYIVQFHNRVLVLIQWGWSYFTRNRSARLITGESGKREPQATQRG